MRGEGREYLGRPRSPQLSLQRGQHAAQLLAKGTGAFEVGVRGEAQALSDGELGLQLLHRPAP
jgi:hypothetical protein